MKGMRFLLPLLGLLLSACGDGSIQSPDFTRELTSLEIREPGGTTFITEKTVPAGVPVQLVTFGTFTAPPGEDPKVEQVGSDWSSGNATVATVNASGLVSTLKTGDVTITAEKNGLKPTVVIHVLPPELDSLIIVPNLDNTNTSITSDTIAPGSQKSYRTLGVYTDGTKTPITAAWTTENPDVVAPAQPVANPQRLVAPAAATGSANVTAQVFDTDNNPVRNRNNAEIKATLLITIGNATLTGELQVTLDPAVIGQTFQSQAKLTGVYSDGQRRDIDPGSVTWDSATPAVATIDANSGFATGVSQGTSVITGTLKLGTEPQVPNGPGRSASAPLTVTGNVCTSPFLSPNATASSSVAGLCVGCSVTPANAAPVIDNDDTTGAVISLPVSLLGGSASITVTSNATYTPTPGANPPGFLVQFVPGQVVSADLLSAITVDLLSGTNVVQSSSASIPLRLDLLGMSLGGGTITSVTVPGANVAFNGMRLTFASGVVSALSSLQVNSACATTAPVTTP